MLNSIDTRTLVECSEEYYCINRWFLRWSRVDRCAPCTAVRVRNVFAERFRRREVGNRTNRCDVIYYTFFHESAYRRCKKKKKKSTRKLACHCRSGRYFNNIIRRCRPDNDLQVLHVEISRKITEGENRQRHDGTGAP